MMQFGQLYPRSAIAGTASKGMLSTLAPKDVAVNHPRTKEILSDKSFVVASFMTNLAEKLERQLGYSRQRQPCGCDVDRGDRSPLEFPEDTYEDEPEEDFDDEDLDDEDEYDEDVDDEDLDDEDLDDENDDDVHKEDSLDEDHENKIEQDMVDGDSHRYARSSAVVSAAEDRSQAAVMLKVRNDRKVLEEELRERKLFDTQKRKFEEDRIQLLQRLRLEDEERRKRELQEKQRKERIEQEIRKKRAAAEADQAARSFLFKSTLDARVDIVKQIVEVSPAESDSLASIPTFSTASATSLAGWEYINAAEGVGKVGEEHGIQETLLHVAVRVGCFDLVFFFITKGAHLDALDFDGRTPLHTAAKHSVPLRICKLLLEKAPYHIDKTTISTGKTALHYAAQNGYGDLVILLLQHHARVNATDNEGNTPETLAKARVDHEKSTKAKAQKYRTVLQHIQKALVTIKEAQRQKEAQMEEQRKKDEELARKEAEKDRAARRKQEEKLEADQRRREEEEKELARLKALAADPRGHSNGGSGNKKKKKKK
ncbi:hypothetical protein BGZ65_009734, partial [Modicella reniformis]